ncbi:MAG: energy transducer TonB [Elusimicrobia bacterium]|nr:energy transducer TonB [Elusimicrobiota bacterium]
MRAYWDHRDPLFEKAVAVSAGLHLLVWGAAQCRKWFRPGLPMPVIEVDLRAPFKPRMPWDTRAPGAAKGAPAPAPKPTPGRAGPKRPAAPSDGLLAPDAVAAPPVQEKPWILPGPKTRTLEKPVLAPPAPPPVSVGARPDGAGPGGEGGLGGSGGGTGTGEAIVNRPPRLINVQEIRASLKRLYPERERRAGREGQVLVAIHVGEDGRVRGVEVLESAGEAFDETAGTVARRMIFEPALVRSVPTAVKVKQAVVFRLGD